MLHTHALRLQRKIFGGKKPKYFNLPFEVAPFTQSSGQHNSLTGSLFISNSKLWQSNFFGKKKGKETLKDMLNVWLEMKQKSF